MADEKKTDKKENIEYPLQDIFDELNEKESVTKIEIGTMLREKSVFSVNILKRMIDKLRKSGTLVYPEDKE
jgi:hypothetical protein